MSHEINWQILPLVRIWIWSNSCHLKWGCRKKNQLNKQITHFVYITRNVVECHKILNIFIFEININKSEYIFGRVTLWCLSVNFKNDEISDETHSFINMDVVLFAFSYILSITYGISICFWIFDSIRLQSFAWNHIW